MHDIKSKNLFFPEISAIKGLAIIFVLILHICAYADSFEILRSIYAQLHIWQAISIFVLILGFTFRIEIEKGYSIGRIVSNRTQRMLIPLVVAYLLSFIILNFLHIKVKLDWHVYIGYLPIHGMGAYFITLYFEVILFFFLFYIFVKKYNIYFNIIFFLLLTILIELISRYITIVDPYVYHSSVHRFIPLIVVGYYFYDEMDGRTHSILYIMGVISIIFYIIYLYQGSVHFILFDNIKSGTQSYPYEYYTFLFTLILYKIFRYIKHYHFFQYFVILGNASMHIFFIQLFVFYIFYKNKVSMNIPVGFLVILLSIAFGIIWHGIESYLIKKGSK